MRWPAGKRVPDLSRVVVAVDPAATSGEEADETGIIVAGRDYNGHGYVLDEFPSVGGEDAGTRAAVTMPPGTRVLSRYRRHTNTLASLRQSGCCRRSFRICSRIGCIGDCTLLRSTGATAPAPANTAASYLDFMCFPFLSD